MDIYKILFILNFTLLTLMRGYFRIRYHSLFNRKSFSIEGFGLILFRYILGSILLTATFHYIFITTPMVWAYIPFPPVIRVVGGFTGFPALVIIFLAHLSLGDNFSTTTEIKDGQTLITSGVYRYTRNPMYSSYCLLFMSSFFLSENWIIGATGVMIILSLMTVRLKKEEEGLLRTFGKAYVEYAEKTGRFLPRLVKNRRALYRKVKQSRVLQTSSSSENIPEPLLQPVEGEPAGGKEYKN